MHKALNHIKIHLYVLMCDMTARGRRDRVYIIVRTQISIRRERETERQ